jgi:hypothetical protein
MIALNFRNVVLLLLLSPVFNCFSQTDTTLAKAKEPDFVNEKFKERTSMFYVAGKGSVVKGFDIFANAGIYSMYDFKVAKMHAVGAGLGYFIQYYMPGTEESPEYNGLNQGIELSFTYKFLYNLENRMSKGLTGNNFSANYFFFSPEFIYLIKPYSVSDVAWDFTKGAWAINSEHENRFIPLFKMGYGIQRTFKCLTFDINAGVQLGQYSNKSSYQNSFFYAQITAGYIFK